MKKVKKLKAQQTKQIFLSEKNLGDDGLRNICNDKTHLITYMGIGGNKITPIGMQYFSKANWRCLIHLYLRNNLIGGKGCKYLTRAAMDRIQNLSLGDNHFGREGILHLSKKKWKNLQEIQFSRTKFTSESLGWLNKSNWEAIKYIDIGKNDLEIKQTVILVLSQFKTIRTLFIRKVQDERTTKQMYLRFYKMLTSKFIYQKHDTTEVQRQMLRNH